MTAHSIWSQCPLFLVGRASWVWVISSRCVALGGQNERRHKSNPVSGNPDNSRGPKSGQAIKLAPFQKQFVKGALADGINVAVLSIGRGNAKTALSAGIVLGAVMGEWDRQPKREIIIAARTRDQGRTAFDFAVGFMRGLPDTVQAQFTVRRSPRLEIEFTATEAGI